MIIWKYPEINGVSVEYNTADGVIDQSTQSMQIKKSVEKMTQNQLSHRYDFVRVGIPCEWGIQNVLFQHGYLIVDRTIQVKVPVKKTEIIFDRFCRLEVERCAAPVEDIYRIAENSFRGDCRFQLDIAHLNEAVYQSILHQWIMEQTEFYVCRYKGEIIGFAGVKLTDESVGNPFICLAAVEKKYRATGAAISLYASVFRDARENGYSYVYGRISSGNMAVLNLYSSFDAAFAEPLDIYIKGEIR